MNDAAQRFELNGPDTSATGCVVDGGFLVFAGAKARREMVPSAASSLTAKRDELIAQGALIADGNGLRLVGDLTFGSPSGAASILLGRHANGWVEWKTADGRTLSEVQRVAVAPRILDDAKRQEIVAKQRELLDAGRIDSLAVLEQRYAKFRERFGPAVLSRLDGEALLDLIHDHTDKDSLVYWLEFKNDDDFETKRFGSISGGSALKYGLFRKKETGRWNAADSTNRPAEISVDQAVAMARSHRDQLLRGLEALEALPDSAGPEDYGELQDRMDEVAPDVGALSWGHKYFSLLYPRKLDAFHSWRWQRFHLRKLLVEPPVGQGRYICAGHFIAAAREVELHPNHLAAVLNSLHGRRHRYWRIGTRNGDNQKSQWEMMRARSVIAVGWEKLSDLKWVEATRISRERLRAELAEKHPNTPSVIGRGATELVNFIAVMSEGDIVWAADGATILGIGRVRGEYEHHAEFEFPHQRAVDWLDLREWKMPVHEGLRSTVREIKRHAVNIVETERRIQQRNPPPPPTGPRTPVLAGIEGRVRSVLDRKGQVLLYGPPGTGKTFSAERAARNLAAIAAFGKRFDDLDDRSRGVVTGGNAGDGLVRLCCFHPSCGYEDFIEGYQPHEVDGQVTFRLRDGIFKRLCRDAAKQPDRSYFLVIDEINRGDVPRIFGELLTILEKDKRGRAILLPVSQEAFSVPPNVFVIGTMNTADRSISLLDAALRRRFGFIELMPDPTVLGDAIVGGIPLSAWMDVINARIREHVGRDARNLQIGHSYLMHAGGTLKSVGALRRAMRDDIVPLLEEYCYENYATLARILGDALVDMNEQRIRHELFEADREEDLLQALLFPEIATSAAAVTSEVSVTGDGEDAGDAAEDSEDADEVDDE